MKRDFPIVATIRDGQMHRTCKITCGECGHVGDIGNQSFGTKRANELAPRKFRERGWLVGRRPADDRCPLHNPRLRSTEPDSPHPEETEMPKAPINHFDGQPLAAEPPRTMSFIDRRVILTKIEEVYIDEKIGYASGWSDRKVATDLNVPQAWVAELREQNFGPAINEDFAEIAREIAAIEEKFKPIGEAIAILMIMREGAIDTIPKIHDLRETIENLRKKAAAAGVNLSS